MVVPFKTLFFGLASFILRCFLGDTFTCSFFVFLMAISKLFEKAHLMTSSLLPGD
jgi:hypothetical protein